MREWIADRAVVCSLAGLLLWTYVVLPFAYYRTFS